MKLGVSTDFSAAHSLPRHPGKCKNLHGHTYKVEVVVEGERKLKDSNLGVTLHSIKLREGKDKWVLVELD